MKDQPLPALDGIIQTPLAAGHVGQFAFTINIDVHGLLLFKLFDMLLFAGYPAGRNITDRLKGNFNALMGMSYTHFPLILPGVHPMVAPLIMFRLKRRGFSNCRVEVTGSGLVVYADR